MTSTSLPNMARVTRIHQPVLCSLLGYKKEREARSVLEENIIRGRVSVQNSSSSSFSLCPTLMFKSSCKYSSV